MPKKKLTFYQEFGRNNNGRYKNTDGLKKSFFTEDGIRYRVLRRKEVDRWLYLDLPQNTWMKNVNHICYIYTLEQATERNIEFREDWKEPKPDTEKEWFGNNVYYQNDRDWET